MLKRLFDIILSSIGLIGSAPLWLIFSLLVKSQDGGPVFYSQERVGKGGRIFRVIKFRSMIKDAEKATGPVQAVENDPRVTKVGRILRKTAMDELPQLLQKQSFLYDFELILLSFWITFRGKWESRRKKF